MSAEHLVAMANQIGDFFDSQGDREHAVAGIADHLRRFWAPTMRREIGAYLAGGGAGLKDSVAQAVQSISTSRSQPKSDQAPSVAIEPESRGRSASP